MGVLCASASAQVRLFIAPDGEEGNVAETGNTTASMTAGTTLDLSVWIDDSASADMLNFYQIIMRQNAVGMGGAEGTVNYLDDGMPNGDSAFVDADRADFIFAGEATGVPFYNENAAQDGFGFIANLLDLNGGVLVTDTNYVGEFTLTASADACGMHELAFVPAGGFPAGGTSMGGPGGLSPYPLDGADLEIQNLTIDLGPCGGGCTEPCDDGDACTVNDGCDGDTCVGTPVDCSGDGDACNAASCDAGGAEGNCDILTPTNDGGGCDDGNACTIDDSCSGGDCAGDDVDCSGQGDDCNTASCNAGGADGNCDNLTPANEGGACDGGNGTCMGGTCMGGGEVTTRLFMSADGAQGGQPTSGNTTITVAPGGTVDVGVWLDDQVQAEMLNFYQLIVRWQSTGGTTGTVEYLDDGMLNGGSAFVDVDADDFVFGGAMIGPVFYNETQPPPQDMSGFGFIANLSSLNDGVDVTGINYVGEFSLTASADADGTFVLDFVPPGGFPAAGTSLGQPGGLAPYAIAEMQSLNIVVGVIEPCPAGAVAMVDPVDGTVDARQPHPVGSLDPAQGIDTFEVTGPADADSLACWSICETDDGGDPNGVASVVDNGGGSYTITLDRPATVGAVTALLYDNATVGRIFFHPSNVNGDDLASPLDILAIIDILNGVLEAPFGDASSDIDRSDLVAPPDILAVIDLLNGADTHDVWLDTSLPDEGGCE
jgi:hypothetical protein